MYVCGVFASDFSFCSMPCVCGRHGFLRCLLSRQDHARGLGSRATDRPTRAREGRLCTVVAWRKPPLKETLPPPIKKNKNTEAKRGFFPPVGLLIFARKIPPPPSPGSSSWATDRPTFVRVDYFCVALFWAAVRGVCVREADVSGRASAGLSRHHCCGSCGVESSTLLSSTRLSTVFLLDGR